MLLVAVHCCSHSSARIFKMSYQQKNTVGVKLMAAPACHRFESICVRREGRAGVIALPLPAVATFSGQ